MDTKIRWWPSVVLGSSVACLLFALYAVVMFGHARPAETGTMGSVIPQPGEWVPFSADVVVSHPGDLPAAHGRFYRDEHGCTRLETGPQGEIRVISILNVPKEAYYRHNATTGPEWFEGPMVLPSDGWKPREVRTDMVGLVRHPLLVEVRRGRPYSLRSDSGFGAYRYVNLGGTLSLQVPDLNFFDIMKVTIEGRHEAYSNVELGPQAEEFFSPPVGATIVRVDEPGGIVAESVAGTTPHIERMRGGH